MQFLVFEISIIPRAIFLVAAPEYHTNCLLMLPNVQTMETIGKANGIVQEEGKIQSGKSNRHEFRGPQIGVIQKERG